MGLSHPMEQELEPDMPWGVGQDDDDFEPPPVNMGEEESDT